MQALKIVSFIWNHPLNKPDKLAALSRFLKWQIASRILPDCASLPFVNNTKLVAERNMVGATGNWYCGLHEPDDMGFVLHALRPDELFVDVGANIGSFSILAAGAVGAKVVSIEPVPQTHVRLMRNIRFNDLADRIEAHCMGASSEIGELRFTAHLDSMNRLALADELEASIVVPVTMLDVILGGRQPSIMKIDVEGHESSVLAGAQACLSSQTLQAVVMETNGSGEKFGVSDDLLFTTMGEHGFTPCTYDVVTRKITVQESRHQNTIFVRDVQAMQAKCLGAPEFNLINGRV